MSWHVISGCLQHNDDDDGHDDDGKVTRTWPVPRKGFFPGRGYLLDKLSLGDSER